MTPPTVEYRRDVQLDPVEVARVFDESGIRRPTDDLPRIARMFSAPSLQLSAWVGDELVGVSRSLTDYVWCCYLSDLAVSRKYQRRGIGRELVRRTQEILGTRVTLILLAAPEAMAYYDRIGFEPAANAFVKKRS